MTAQQQHQPHQTHHRPRVAVVGQLRMYVEAVSRPLAKATRVRTVSFEASPSTPMARDAVLRVKAEVVVLVVTAADTLDRHGLVAALAERGERVVVTGQVGEADARAELLAAGATAVCGGGVADLLRALRRAARPALVPCRIEDAARWTATVPAQSRERRIWRNLGSLSPAEARILGRLMAGRTVADIAQDHVVSVETVRSQISAVLAKMETPSQLAAVASAHSVGWRAPGVDLTAA